MSGSAPSGIAVLITGAGAPGTRGTLYALRENGTQVRPRIVGVDLRPNAVGRYLCDAFHTVPAPESPDYITRLLDVARRERATVLLPQTTREIAVIAAARETIEAEGFRAVVASPQAITRGNDKFEVCKTFERLGLPFPDCRVAASESELCAYAHDLGYPDTPVVVKPPISNGMRGFRVLTESPWDAARFLSEKPSGTEIRLADLVRILRTVETWPPLLVTEYLPGPEYSVDAFVGAKCAVAIPRLREQIRSGISFITRCEARPDLSSYTLAAARDLGLRFAFGFQYKLDRAGVPKVLECNPRVQGTMVASVFAGVNVIWMAVSEALGQPLAAGLSGIRPARFYRFWGGLGVVNDQPIDI